MTRRDDGLLDGAAVDVFGARFGAVNDNRVTSGPSDTGCVAPEGHSVALSATPTIGEDR